MNDDATLTKREALESLLDQGDVLIQLDPRRAGVRVPDHLTGQPLLVLRIGLDMPVPIPDLRVHTAGVEGTLSFNREPHHVTVPWEAIFGMVSEGGRGLLWTGDVPQEIFDQVMRLEQSGGELTEDLLGGSDPRPHLVALDGGLKAGTPQGEGEASRDRRAPPHLRLVE